MWRRKQTLSLPGSSLFTLPTPLPRVQHVRNLLRQITHISNLWKIRIFRCNRICRRVYPFRSDQRYTCSKECFQNDHYSPRMAPSVSTALSTITLPLHFQNTNTNVVLNKSHSIFYIQVFKQQIPSPLSFVRKTKNSSKSSFKVLSCNPVYFTKHSPKTPLSKYLAHVRG
jgi:hypothetical protein